MWLLLSDSLYFRLRYVHFTLVILFMCVIATFMIIGQSKVLLSNKSFKPNLEIVPLNDVKSLKVSPEKVSTFYLNTENVLHVTDKRFLSFSIDSSQIHRGFIHPSLKDSKLRNIISYLGGGYLRLGGTAADLVIFKPASRAWPYKFFQIDGGECAYDHQNCPVTDKKSFKTFVMSAADWIEINEFAKATGFRLLFDFNVLLRINDTWDSTNAELLLDFSFAHQFEVDWQLGNEPDAFKFTFGVEVSPDNLASDYTTLRQLLQRYSLYNSSLIVGPDVCRPKRLFLPADTYLTDFLAAGAQVDAITWHHYYTGPNATLEDFLNPALYDSFKHSCQVMYRAARKSLAPLKPMWIGETGSAYGGGVANLSNRFVSSFLWIDKLGTAAREGISLVIRQSIYRGHYSLLDQNTLDPNSDYWVSILYKQLVQNEVLEISSVREENDGTLRVYAHCSVHSSVVVFGVNIANFTNGLYLKLNTTGYLYSLTGSSNLLSRHVRLNGIQLALIDGKLPALTPVIVSLLNPVPILPYSIFFLQIRVNSTVCT